MRPAKNNSIWMPFLRSMFMILISSHLAWAAQDGGERTGEPGNKQAGSTKRESPNSPQLELKLSPEGVIRKLNLQGDRQGLRNGFQINQRSGTESGGGGSQNRDLFYSAMRKSIEILRREPSFQFSGSALILPSKLEDALRASTVIPTRKKLTDREGAPVDLINDPQDLVIWFNLDSWNQFPLEKQIQLGLHELLGLLEIPDPLYKYSAQLQLYVLKNWNKEAPQRRVIQKVVSKKALLKLMQEAQWYHQDVVLSLQCEKYSRTHHGFCLIRSVVRDGKTQEVVYLVDGSVDDFKSGIIANSKRSATLFTDVHPQDMDQMEAWINFDQGVARRWSESECRAQGYSTAPGTWCVYAEYAEEP